MRWVCDFSQGLSQVRKVNWDEAKILNTLRVNTDIGQDNDKSWGEGAVDLRKQKGMTKSIYNSNEDREGDVSE